jgi:hypothetical protein
MDPFRLLMRMAMWSRRPPSLRRVLVAAAVIAIALGVVAAEKAGYWPDWARSERVPHRGVPQGL